MDESILNSIKSTLGYAPEDTGFDSEIMLHINTMLADLALLGVGPPEGVYITDATTTWTDLTDQAKLNLVRSYVFLRVKMMFDSNNMPAHLISAYERQIEELGWKITVLADPKIPQILPPEEIATNV